MAQGWVASVATLTLVALGSAEPVSAGGFRGGVGEALGPRFEAVRGLRSPPATRRAGDAMNHLRHWNQIAVDASGLDHTPVAPGETARLRRAARSGAREPRDGDRAHRDLRRGERDRRRLSKLHRAARGARRHLDGRAPSRRRRTIRWSRCSRRRRRASTPNSLRIWPRSASGIDAISRTGSASAAARPRRSSIRRANDGSDHTEPRIGVDFITERRAGQMAAGPDQSDPDRAGRALGRGAAVRPAGRPTSSAYRRRPQSTAPSTPSPSTR